MKGRMVCPRLTMWRHLAVGILLIFFVPLGAWAQEPKLTQCDGEEIPAVSENQAIRFCVKGQTVWMKEAGNFGTMARLCCSDQNLARDSLSKDWNKAGRQIHPLA